MADKNPWYDPKLPRAEATSITRFTLEAIARLGEYWNTDWSATPGTTERENIMCANTQSHDREGQNVLFADGHTSFEKAPDVGFKNDNIYTRIDIENVNWSNRKNASPWRTGIPIPQPNRKGEDETPANKEDSLLANDFIEPVR